MNWGKAIVLSFVLFATFILTIIYKMMNQRVDLVKEDYYVEELNYQKQIDRISNAKNVQSATVLKYSAETNEIVITLPESVKKGDVMFFRPSDKSLDFKKSFNETNTLSIPTTTMAKGRWKVQVFWSDGQSEYYKEEEIFI